MNEQITAEIKKPEASPRQPAIDFFEQEAVRLEAQIQKLNTGRKRAHALSLDELDQLPETQKKAASYREIAVGIAGGEQEALDQGYLALEDIHADLCAEVSQAYQEYQAKEQELAGADDTPYQNAQAELQAIRQQKEEAFRDKNWDQEIAFSQEEMTKRAEMQQTPTGQLKARIETLNRTMKINSQKMGPISVAAKSLYPTPTV